MLSISFLVDEAIGDLLQPAIMASMVDVGVAKGDMDYVLKMGGYMLLVTAIGELKDLREPMKFSHRN